MISNVSWVPKGVADPKPKRFEMSPAERQLLTELQMQQLKVEEEEYENDAPTKNEKNGLPAELRMDEYSSSDDDDEDAAVGKLLVGSDVLDDIPDEDNSKSSNSSKDDDDEDDDLEDVPDTREYMPIDMEGLQSMSLANVDQGMMLEEGYDEQDEEDSDAEDTDLRPDDALVLVSKTEEESSSLEIYVYEQKTGNLFIHHDITLPSLPLCLAHGDINTEGTSGNYCAVGMFTPGIELWNLDILDALEPMCVFGGEDSNITSKKLKNRPKLAEGSHTDAVMSLSWNATHRNLIASGSADKTVKLWNITGHKGPPVSTLTHHTDKVQSVVWHPLDGTILATGSYDKTAALVDARCSKGLFKKVKLSADCESIAWDPSRPENLTVATEDGTVVCWDVRNFSDKAGPLWSFVAHEFGGVSDVCYNSHVPGMMATCAIDKTVALWDAHSILSEHNIKGPQPCGVKDMAVGKLYSVSFYPSSPWLLGCGGSTGDLALWDMSQEKTIQSRFGKRVGLSSDIPIDDSSNKPENLNISSILNPEKVDAPAEKARDKTVGKHKNKSSKSKKKVHRR